MKSIAIILILMLPVMLFAQADDRGYIVNIGDKAPDFELKLTDGTKFKLSDYKGKMVMLQFTASWCGVCRREMPYIEKDIWDLFTASWFGVCRREMPQIEKDIWVPNKDKDFVLIGVDRDEDVQTVKAFKKQTGISYPLALDDDGKVFSLYAEENAGVTRNVLINKDGEIIFMTRLFNEEEFKGLVKKINSELGKK